ncbi:hypothetical protein CEE36_11365 [candidate division TA06 bacterium B3_TA06]|uniref:Uncharacterized protein n=1 Tax=candidate division TA06 bacterium B3_TA06 TaxID=2012487 RepID=A0A532UPM1_UNCT6|nr:MAG: hypothetical protein CEE36_11365 [candidate division TA06 bacterium B3_TA06]
MTEFDADEIRRIHESGAAKRVKREWIKKGYDQQMSLYGVVTDEALDEAGYKRIEILSDTLYDDRIVALIFEFFQYFKPESPYTIWIHSTERDALKQVGAYK